jgi:Ser/Thr protein kinase RdoA (MazF antagonist)
MKSELLSVLIMIWNELQELWPIPEPWSVRPIAQGVNNLTQVIDSPAGSYVLRAYRADRSLRQIRYELQVLSSLQEKSLPFQVPAPILTVNAERFAILSGTVMSLSARIPGSMPQSNDLEQAYAAGSALAELGKALVDVRIETTDEVAPFPPSGDFQAWAGIAIDLPGLLQQLPLTLKERQRILFLFEEIQSVISPLYQSLPQQIIHRDYDQSNVLMEGHAVTGILDFEFCGPDLRIRDLAYALCQWPSGLWNTGREWAIMNAFARGYLQRQVLTLNEFEALPQIFRLREATSLSFHLGRFAQGVETKEEVSERIQEALIIETWLETHTRELVRNARTWQH